MKLAWSARAVGDLARLHEFLAPVDPQAAAQVVQRLTAVASQLLDQPRIGERLEQYEPREVRRLLVAKYELRYEIRGQRIFIVRIWHTREDR
ncbi:MAG: type II toxin-antitoxin system RelE/ParE family toxin [Myxococcales bacterium]